MCFVGVTPYLRAIQNRPLYDPFRFLATAICSMVGKGTLFWLTGMGRRPERDTLPANSAAKVPPMMKTNDSD